MNTKKEISTGVDYQEKYTQLSDSEIKEILILRNSYQAEAANAAIQEAIKRGIIKSEQDLFAEEYRQDKTLSNFFFPHIGKTQQKAKILSSIHRILYILGIIPLVFAGLTYMKGNIFTSVAYAAIGLIWIFLNYRLSKTKNVLLLWTMTGISIIGLSYSVYAISNLFSPQTMDYAVVLLSFLVSLYCLLFARSIIKN